MIIISQWGSDLPSFQVSLSDLILLPENRLHFFRRNTPDNILLEFPPPSANAFLISGMGFLPITSMYLYKFIIPSIGISEVTTEKLKLPQNIFLGS